MISENRAEQCRTETEPDITKWQKPKPYNYRKVGPDALLFCTNCYRCQGDWCKIADAASDNDHICDAHNTETEIRLCEIATDAGVAREELQEAPVYNELAAAGARISCKDCKEYHIDDGRPSCRRYGTRGDNKDARYAVCMQYGPAKAKATDTTNTAQDPAAMVDVALIGPVGFHLTDLGNSKRLIRDHHMDLLYCNQWRKWQVWDGQRWRQDDTGEIKRRAIATVASMFDDLKLISGRDEREKYFKFIMRCESESKIGSMIRLAESDARVSVTQDRFDQDAYKLNFKNGTLDLKAMEFYPHRREDNITKMCNVEYVPGASCDSWKACLATWLDGNTEDIRFVQKALGYSLTGSTGEHVFFILYGTGRNGKSTFLDIVRHILNDYATSTPVESILQKKSAGIPNDIARLAGARFVTTVESDEGRKLAESLIKLLTGGDIVTARFLYGEFFDYQPQFKLWVATNHRPEIKGTDPAIWARVRLIPFNKMIPEDKRDKDLGAKLRAEASGIVNWMLEGYRLWQSEGHLKPSATVTAATTDYKNQMDDLGSFIADRCDTGPDESAYNKNLYASYVSWSEDEGLKSLSNKAFTLRLKERGFTNKHAEKGKIWFGLSLLDEAKINKADGSLMG